MSTPFYFFDVSPVEKILSGLTPHTFLITVSQAVPSTTVLRQGAFYIIFLFQSKHIDECHFINVLRLCAFPLSIVNLLVNQHIGEFCIYNGSQYQQ